MIYSSGKSKFIPTAVTTRVRRKKVLPRLSDFPIPQEARSGGPGWGAQMIEMADHIGARATLLICENFGGRNVYIPLDPALNPFIEIIGEKKAAIISQVYPRERLAIAAAKIALNMARRAGVIAAVRAGQLSLADAAIIMGTDHTYASHLLNHTDEGVGVAPAELPIPRNIRLLTDAAAIAEAEMNAAGIPPETIARVKTEILDLAA